MAIPVLLEKMAACAAQMRTAAEQEDWDRLAACERDFASHRDHVMRAGLDLHAAVDDADRDAVITLLRGIQADNEAVRAHVLPWMESTRKFLAQTGQARRVEQAYGNMR